MSVPFYFIKAFALIHRAERGPPSPKEKALRGIKKQGNFPAFYYSIYGRIVLRQNGIVIGCRKFIAKAAENVFVIGIGLNVNNGIG